MVALKILYSPALHGVLEYDELSTLCRLGHRVFSMGDYWNRDAPRSDVRRLNSSFYDDELTQKFLRDPACSYPEKKVSYEFCQNFDVVIVSGVEVWMHQNWDSFGRVPVVFRTIGQSNLGSEALLSHYGDRITVVRYSEREVGLPGFARTDGVIYFGKDLADYPKWTGGGNPITFHSHYVERDHVSLPNISDYNRLTDGLSASLHGINVVGAPNYRGHLHHTEQFSVLAQAGCYIYVWSQPPSYTLSLVEAMLVGTPIVAPSTAFVARHPPDPSMGWTPQRYEVSSLLADGCGLTYDSVEEGRSQIEHLLIDRLFAEEVSAHSRARARELFDTNAISQKWAVLLGRSAK